MNLRKNKIKNLINRPLFGDSRWVMKRIPDNSIDSMVTDPPYGLKFMGRKWDYDVPSVKLWKETLRILKPGAHACIFGGTRTYHRLLCNVEDAGFEVRDCILWIYSSGFPKNHDISKSIDKLKGKEFKIIGTQKITGQALGEIKGFKGTYQKDQNYKTEFKITEPSDPDAQKWDGFGTALKPATELIALIRKPISEKTIAENVLKYGTGAININKCRIGNREIQTNKYQGDITSFHDSKSGSEYESFIHSGGWPSNVIFDESRAAELDFQSGEIKTGDIKKGQKLQMKYNQNPNKIYGHYNEYENEKFEGKKASGASIFFYVCKPSKAEKNELCENLEVKTTNDGRKKSIDNPYQRGKTLRNNFHPTVKPKKLIQYLINLITRPGGIVIDPFFGSGTLGPAARENGFDFIGIEKDFASIQICKARLRQGYLF